MTTAFIAGVGPLELLLVLLIVLVIVGGKRLPQLGRQLGGGIREFKDSVTRKTGDQYADEPCASAADPARPRVPPLLH
jgi:sec-independent protein translocase protein TatA